MALRINQTKYIDTLSVAVQDRYLEPTDNQIAELKKDIEEKGQRVPILVHRILRNTYRLVAGMTRLQAMVQLGEKKIYATICSADSPEDIQIAELDENVMRRDLTAEQRSEMKKKMIELQKQVMAKVEPAKGGRGKKGGISEAARTAGISRRTAERRKGAHNPKSAQVSAKPAKPDPHQKLVELAESDPAKMAKEYTKLIQKHKLYEGACHLPWAKYFEYRNQHPDECNLLTNEDLAYVGQWTDAGPDPVDIKAVDQLTEVLAGLRFYTNRQEHPAWPIAIEAIGGSAELLKTINALQEIGLAHLKKNPPLDTEQADDTKPSVH